MATFRPWKRRVDYVNYAKKAFEFPESVSESVFKLMEDALAERKKGMFILRKANKKEFMRECGEKGIIWLREGINILLVSVLVDALKEELGHKAKSNSSVGPSGSVDTEKSEMAKILEKELELIETFTN